MQTPSARAADTPSPACAPAGAPGAVTRPRGLERIVAGQEVVEGAGVRTTRLLTQDLQRRLDPFLMLDAFRSDDPDDYLAGFPDHPHRGFETITVMVAGRMRHRDSAGHEGLVTNGGVQWMTAGRGVVHSEMPEQEDGEMSGYQFWLNLPARDKLCAPWYRDIPADAIPRVTTPQGVRVGVIAGESHGVAGAVTRDATRPLMLDVEMPAGSRFAQPLAPEFNAFVVVHRGRVEVAGRAFGERCLAILSSAAECDGVEIVAHGDAKLLLVAGRPLREPIVQYGPFVMNSRDEILQTMIDYRDGRMGGIA